MSATFYHMNAELTHACNLRCSYCFNESGLKQKDELSTDDWRKVIDWAKSSGVESILFTGGEVTLRKDAPQIIDYAIQNGLHANILSNGFGIEKMEYSNVIKKLDRVQISLDSANPTIHDARRGKGSWETARKSIDYVRSLSVPVEISVTISEDTLNELGDVAKIAKETGSNVLIRPCQPIGRAFEENTDSSVLESMIEKETRRLRVIYGDIFVADFARYVPILGFKHDSIVNQDGFFTVLPNGIIRGSGNMVPTLTHSS